MRLSAHAVIRRLLRLPEVASALRGRRGTTSLEFAVIASGLFTAIFAILEISLQLATMAALEWTALRASRFGITGSTTVRGAPGSMPSCRSAIIPWLVNYSTGGFLTSANLVVTVNNYSTLSAGTGGTGGTSGAGAGGAVVGYDLAYTQRFLTPIPALITGSAQMVHRVTIVIKNEPFDNATC